MKYSALLLVVLCIACQQNARPQMMAAVVPPPNGVKMNGLTFVAPPSPPVVNPMDAVKAVGADWIAVVPYAFTPPGKAMVRYHENGGQWWGETPDGVRETIRMAHAAGIRVMVKPQVWVPRNWTGLIDFATDAEWEQWEKDYEHYILKMAAIAAEQQTDLFCIGTEFRTPISKRPEYWRGLIGKIRQVYPGKLVYSANWDDWEQVPFWDQLDYIGLSGYFPLVEGKTPDVEALKAAWQPIRQRLKTFSEQHGKPILFTEYGYLSVDGCGWQNWELEKGIEDRAINEQAQANCYEALLSVFQAEAWWAGCFLWKWFPNMQGHEGYPERDYTPQGKLGETVIRNFYSKR